MLLGAIPIKKEILDMGDSGFNDSREIAIADYKPQSRLFVPAMVVATAPINVSKSILMLFPVDVVSIFNVSQEMDTALRLNVHTLVRG